MAGSALLDQVTRGDHVCWIVEDEELRLDTLATVVAAGLRRRERVVYSGDDPEGMLAGIERRGVPAAEAVERGSLRASTAESSLLVSGVFDPAAATACLREEQERGPARRISGTAVHHGHVVGEPFGARFRTSGPLRNRSQLVPR